MIINDHTQDQVRINHLGVIMTLLDNKDNCFSYYANGLVVDTMDCERGISKCHREFKFDEKGLLYASVLYEAEDMEKYNKTLLGYGYHNEESEDFE